MLGIEPTQMEELRRKQGMRLVLEETLTNVGFLLTLTGHKLSDCIDSGILVTNKIKGLKKYSFAIIAAIAIVFAMVF